MSLLQLFQPFNIWWNWITARQHQGMEIQFLTPTDNFSSLIILIFKLYKKNSALPCAQWKKSKSKTRKCIEWYKALKVWFHIHGYFSPLSSHFCFRLVYLLHQPLFQIQVPSCLALPSNSCKTQHKNSGLNLYLVQKNAIFTWTKNHKERRQANCSSFF